MAKNNNGNGSTEFRPVRNTILFDKELYKAAKLQAQINRQKLYEYINMVVAEDLGRKVPKSLSHSAK